MKHAFFVVLASFYALKYALGQLSSPLPSSSGGQPEFTGATCVQPRASSDPAGTIIGSAISRNGTIHKACNFPYAQVDAVSSMIYYRFNGDYTFNNSFIVNLRGLPSNPCEVNFNALFATCVENGNYWGGWLINGGSNFSSISSII